MAWDDEESAEVGIEKAKLVDDEGNTMDFSVVQEQNSWRIRIDYRVPGHPEQAMMLDAWYPSKFAAVCDLPMVLNVSKSKGWKEVQ